MAQKMNAGETVADAAVAKNPNMAEVADVPGLPRVLLVGDSISIAYTASVREMLKGKANVHRIPANGGSSNSGKANITAWTRDSKWDVIHFNFGIHDARIKSEKSSTLEEYEANLRRIVAALKGTGAKLIFATTTPIPDVVEPPTRKFDKLTPDRNALAIRIMKENEIDIDDLYALMLPHVAEYQRPKDVHYTTEGSQFLAKAVAASIETQLGATAQN
jgi:acyl-CoA thioesterase-1